MPTNDNSDRTTRRTYLKYAGGAAATVGLAGCSGEDVDDIEDEDGSTDVPDEDDETPDQGDSEEDLDITVTQGQMATTLDPHNHRETSTDNIILQAYEGILFRDPEGRIVERLATDWERVEDGEVRYEIRDGVEFHDGEELTAEDCAYSINRVVDPEVSIESPQADQLAGVTGAEAEDGAVHVFSDGFNPMTFANQASYCPVVNQAWTEERDENEVAREANGTGAFEVVEYEEDVEVVLEANENYWDGEPEVTRVTFNNAEETSSRVAALRNEETDLIVNIPPQDAPTVEDDDSAYIEAVPSTRVLFLVMNDHFEPFDSQEFRQAMNYAIDLESMIDNILDGFGDPTGQPTLEGYVGEAEDVDHYPYEPDTAEDLVDDSGYSGAELTLETPVGRYLGDINMAQSAAGYIDDLSNVSCEVEQRDFGAMAGELLDGDQSNSPEFFLIGWGNTTFDASQTLIPWMTPGTATTHFTDDELTDLILSAQEEPDEDERAELMADANRRANELAPWVFLHRQYSVYGLSNRISWDPRQDEHIMVEEITSA